MTDYQDMKNNTGVKKIDISEKNSILDTTIGSNIQQESENNSIMNDAYSAVLNTCDNISTMTEKFCANN